MYAKRVVIVPLPLSMVFSYETHTTKFKLGGETSGYFTSPVYNLAEFFTPGGNTAYVVGTELVHPIHQFIQSVKERFNGEDVVFETFKTPSLVDYSALINRVNFPK